MSGKRKVLIIDDDMGMRRALQRIFEMEDYDVVTKENSDEAIDALKKAFFDLIVIDMRLYQVERGGLRIVRQVLNWSASAIPIIYTAHPSYPDCVRAMRLGAWDYIEKNATDSLQTVLASARQGLEEKLSRPSADERWFQENLQELQDKFGGEVVAVIDGQVVDHAGSYERLMERVKMRKMDEKLPLFALVTVAGVGRSEVAEE